MKTLAGVDTEVVVGNGGGLGSYHACPCIQIHGVARPKLYLGARLIADPDIYNTHDKSFDVI